MARKISQQAASAFLYRQSFKLDNTKVVQDVIDGRTISRMFLHNNEIARLSDNGFFITNCGWFSKTTKERLNALPNVCICQKKGNWYLNGNVWDGNWSEIKL